MQFVRFGFVIINATFAQLCFTPPYPFLSLFMRVPSVRIQLSNWQQAAKIIASKMIEWNKFDYKLVLLIYIFPVWTKHKQEQLKQKKTRRAYICRPQPQLFESTSRIDKYYTFHHRHAGHVRCENHTQLARTENLAETLRTHCARVFTQNCYLLQIKL